MPIQKIRSDCKFNIELKKSGGLKITVNSKVSAMYGKSIIKQIKEMCKFFEIKNAHILLEDYGALPFVIAARFEYAVKKLNPEVQKEFLFPSIKENLSKTKMNRLRRSRLYLPGNQPKFFINAGLHKPDGIILDLEDSVAPSEKDAAKLLVRNALRNEKTLLSELIYKKICKIIKRDFDEFILEKLDSNWGKQKGGINSEGNTKKINYLKIH